MDFGPDIAGYAGKRVGLFGGKFFPPHNGHLAAIADAADQVDVLFVAVQYDEAYEAGLCTGSDFQPIPPRLRERWLSEVFRDRPDIRVLAAYEKRTEDWLTDPELDEIYRDLERRCGHIDVVFSGEDEYTPYFAKWLPEVEHKVVEMRDSAGGVRASDIRRDGVFRAVGGRGAGDVEDAVRPHLAGPLVLELGHATVRDASTDRTGRLGGRHLGDGRASR